MLARNGIRLATRALAPMGPSRLAARFCVPAVARIAPATRSLSTSRARSNADTFRTGEEQVDVEELHSTQHISYLLNGPVGASAESIVEELKDEELASLPLVIHNRMWVPLPFGFTLPRRMASNPAAEDGNQPWRNADYVYRTFKLDSAIHMKRLNNEIAQQIEGRFRVLTPVILLDPRSHSLTVGLPAHIGLQAPFPAKDNAFAVKAMLHEYRAESTSSEKKKEILGQLRQLVVPRGFTINMTRFSRYLNALWNSIRRTDAMQLYGVRFDYRGEIIDGSATDAAAQAPFIKPLAAPRRKRKNSSLAGKLRADDPKLPEAGTFVAQDGDVHKPDADEALEEHVPFPKPSPEEMGMKKPTEP